MALSGSFYKNVGSHWRVYCTWSGSQSVSGNYTDITLKVYWESTDSYGTTNTTDTKSGSASINGSSGNFTFSAKLSGKQRKLVHTRTVRVNHNADGTKNNVSLSATLNIALTLGGTYYGSVTASTTVNLNRIPRASSITSSGSWTAGSSRSVTISRHSSSFTHTVRWQVQDSGGTWRTVKTATGVGTSHNGSFSVSENTSIFTYLAQAGSRNSRIQLETYSGSTKIGETVYKTGTVTAPDRSTFVITNPTNISEASGQGVQTVYIDQTINIKINRKHSAFTHKLVFKDGNSGNVVYTANNVGDYLSWTPNSTQQSQLYQKAKNNIEIDGQVDVYTYYNGVQVRGVYEGDINFRVRESSNKPTFSSSDISYKDINPLTAFITGDNQYIIQGYSILEASINTDAIGKNHATITKYEVTINGVTKSITGTGTVNMGAVNASNSVNLTVKAIDSRGFSTSVSKIVNIIPYSPPNVSVLAERLNGFESQTTLKVQGTASVINVGGTNKNSLIIARRRYKRATTSTYDSWANLSISGFPNFTASNVNLNLDNLAEWDIQVEIADKLSVVTKTIKVPVGRPILYLDADKQSIGIGDFPLYEHEVRVNGRIVFGQNMWATSSQGEGSGALFLNNSDITGVNGIFMNDISNNKGEGIHFLKSGKPEASTYFDDYDTWYIRDGKFYFNNRAYMEIVNDRLYLFGKGISLNAWDRNFLSLSNDGADMIQSNVIYNRTYSGGANVYITQYGTLGRVTSATKYKLNIEEAEVDKIADRILALQPKKWHDKVAVEQYSEYMTKLYNGEIDEANKMDVPYLRKYYGLIAEDLIDVGLDMFVVYGEPNEDGVREVEGIEYDRLWTMLIPIVRNQKEEIKRLEARVSNLEKSHITM